MKKFSRSLRPDEILAVCGGEYRGAENLTLQSVADPSEADATGIVFWEQDKYLDAVQNSSAGLIFCKPEGSVQLPGRNLILHPKPYFALMRLVSWWLEVGSERPQPGIHPSATIDPSAKIGEGAYIGANSVIGKNSVVGERICIGENCSVGENVCIGAGTRLYPNVVIYADCEIGTEVIIHSGASIGSDGFGFILMEGIQTKIPQIGNVRIGNNVEIGANTTIDRGTLASTVIGDGTKIDNLVQIGHNCRIGKHTIICAQTGLAGSTIVGDYVYLAGQVGTAGHITIGDRVLAGGQTGITHDVPPDAQLMGMPAIDVHLFRRIAASQKYLPELLSAYRKQLKKEENKG